MSIIDFTERTLVQHQQHIMDGRHRLQWVHGPSCDYHVCDGVTSCFKTEAYRPSHTGRSITRMDCTVSNLLLF